MSLGRDRDFQGRVSIFRGHCDSRRSRADTSDVIRTALEAGLGQVGHGGQQGKAALRCYRQERSCLRGCHRLALWT
jgi:hypothetical protein